MGVAVLLKKWRRLYSAVSSNELAYGVFVAEDGTVFPHLAITLSLRKVGF